MLTQQWLMEINLTLKFQCEKFETNNQMEILLFFLQFFESASVKS